MQNIAYLLLGGNIGRTELVFKNCCKLMLNSGIEILQKSGLYKSIPWGYDSSLMYLNQAVTVRTSLDMFELLAELHNIESDLGRVRSEEEKYEDRIIDIDILFFNDEICNAEQLIIPHPRLHKRQFALVPLNEISPDYIHPVFNKSIAELLLNCEDDNVPELIYS